MSDVGPGDEVGSRFSSEGTTLAKQSLKLQVILNPKKTLGVVIIRIWFWGPLDYIYSKGTHQKSIANYLGPYSNHTSQ